jgi:hypothetical protein
MNSNFKNEKMKNLIKSIVMFSFISLFVISCKNSPEAKETELEEAKEEVVTAEADLEQAKADSIANFTAFKNSINLKIEENESKIQTLIKNNKAAKNKNTDLYSKELEKLQERNLELKKKLVDYEYGPDVKWELFKVEVNKDIDELGKSISNMAEKNSKQ